MRADIYQEMAKVEGRHWWFRARRTILTHLLRKLKLPPSAAILDAGSGTGGNLAMLSQFGSLFAMEMNASARALAARNNAVTIEDGLLPDKIPYGDQKFDLVTMFDVLEHVERDFDTLRALQERLVPNGKILLTVPAFMFLWSGHDGFNHHKRRYRLPQLVDLCERAGFKVLRASYMNFWLFPLIAAVRIFDRLTHSRIVAKNSDSNVEMGIPPAPINWLLEEIFASETYLLDIMRLPFGVSIVLTAQKA